MDVKLQISNETDCVLYIRFLYMIEIIKYSFTIHHEKEQKLVTSSFKVMNTLGFDYLSRPLQMSTHL